MKSPRRVPIFDGHNDVLLRLYRRSGTEASRAFLEGEGTGHLDLPMARQGGFAGGLFAIFVPSAHGAIGPNGDTPSQDVSGGGEPLPPTVESTPAQRTVFTMVSLLLRIERESKGRVRICRHLRDILKCMKDGALAPVLHIEGSSALVNGLWSPSLSAAVAPALAANAISVLAAASTKIESTVRYLGIESMTPFPSRRPLIYPARERVRPARTPLPQTSRAA
jgi:hypothetical protein